MTLKHFVVFLLLITVSIFGTTATAQDADVQSVQSALSELGYDPGSADGFMGPKTRSAIEAFQRDREIPITGRVDEATLLTIRQNVKQPQEVLQPAAPVPETKTDNGSAIAWALVGGFFVFLLMKLIGGQKAVSSANAQKHQKNHSLSGKPLQRQPNARKSGSNLGYKPSSDYWSGAKSKGKDKKRPAASWIKDGETTVVAGRKIAGLVYVGPAPRTNGYEQTGRSFIDPSLNVAKTGRDPDGKQMSYWPSYSGISASSRASYLDWLASGREDKSYSVGYMFLYFYGLERRFFVDKPSTEEKEKLLNEAKRLRTLFEDNFSARNYLDKFIDVAETTLTVKEDRKPSYDHSGYETPLSVLIEIGTRVSKGEALQADWALCWFMSHPDRHLRTPAKRCRDEFLTLFRQIFKELYPQGLNVKKPKRLLSVKYRAASSEFDLEITPTSEKQKIPDVSGLRKPISDMQVIADRAMAELDKYSRYLGRKPNGRGTIEAQALLPTQLWTIFPSEELNELKLWLKDLISSTGKVPVTDLIRKLEGDDFGKIGKRNLVGAADALSKLGVGMAPDPRYALRAPTANDPVILFNLPNDQLALEEVTDEYRHLLLKLALGAFIAQADGAVAVEEKDFLRSFIGRGKNTTASEALRLKANLEWFLTVPPNIPLLRKNLKSATEIQRREFREVMISMAHADGVIRPEEVSSIEKVYKVLGIESSEIYSDIHSGSISDVPPVVRPEISSAGGERIIDVEYSNDLNTISNTPLDASRIAEIQADTKRVSNVLGDIFGEEESDEVEIQDDNPSPLSALDLKHRALVEELIQRENWSSEDFSLLVKRYDLMVSGSLETINEWAYEKFDDALIEDYNGYEINGDVISQLSLVQ